MNYLWGCDGWSDFVQYIIFKIQFIWFSTWKRYEEACRSSVLTEGADPFKLKIGGIGKIVGRAGESTAMQASSRQSLPLTRGGFQCFLGSPKNNCSIHVFVFHKNSPARSELQQQRNSRVQEKKLKSSFFENVFFWFRRFAKRAFINAWQIDSRL